jgi:hypothetical protein
VDKRQSEAGSEFGTPSSHRCNRWLPHNEPTRPPPDLVGPIFARRPDFAEFSLFLRGLGVTPSRVPKRTRLVGHFHKVIHRPASDSGTPVDSVPSRLQTAFGHGYPVLRTLEPRIRGYPSDFGPPFQIVESNNSSNSLGYQSPILLSLAVDNMLCHLSAEGYPQWLRSTTSSYTKAST